MTTQEIIDALDVAWKLRQLEAQVPVGCEDGLSIMIDASSTIICDVIDNQDALEVILLALKAAAAPVGDDEQLREMIEENGRLKRELDGMRTRLDELTRMQQWFDERLPSQMLRRELVDELKEAYTRLEATQDATDEEPEDSSTEGEIDAESAPAKKPRKATPRHTWTTAEDAWIAEHLNSVRSGEVAERFGVSEKAAYTRMLIVKERLGRS